MGAEGFILANPCIPRFLKGLTHSALAACVIVLNSGSPMAQQDHVAGVARQLLWGKMVADQG